MSESLSSSGKSNNSESDDTELLNYLTTDEHIRIFIKPLLRESEPARTTFTKLNARSRSLHQAYIRSVEPKIRNYLFLTDMDGIGQATMGPSPAGENGTGTTFIHYDSETGAYEKHNPAKNSNYEAYKAVSHSVIGLSAIIVRNGNGNLRAQERKDLEELSSLLVACKHAMEAFGEETGDPLDEAMTEFIDKNVDYINTVIKEETVDLDAFKQMNAESFEYQKVLMNKCIELQVRPGVQWLKDFKKRIGEEKWKRMYFVVRVPWSMRTRSVRVEMLNQVINKTQKKYNLVVTEATDDLKVILSKIAAERVLAEMSFGGSECHYAKKKQRFLSTGMDLLTDNAQDAIKELKLEKVESEVESSSS